MRALNSWNYYAKLPLPHVIFNRLNCKYESLNTLMSSQWKLLFRTVTWCTTFTVTVTWCKLQGAVSDRDKKKKKNSRRERGILPRILNYKDIKRASHWDLKVGYSIKQRIFIIALYTLNNNDMMFSRRSLSFWELFIGSWCGASQSGVSQRGLSF